MAKQWTSNSRYKSNFGDGQELFVTPAQYLTECLCVLIARHDKVMLVPQFWKYSPWDKLFMQQIPTANSLLDEYPPEVILSALRDRRCWNIRSFRAKYILIPVLKDKMAEYEAQMKLVEESVMTKTATDQKPRKPMGSKSILSKLKELDE